jgi:predicted amidohydrolase
MGKYRGQLSGSLRAISKTISNAAKELGCYVIVTDLVGEISHGPWKGLVYDGSSVASDMHGVIIRKCRDRDREVVLVNIEPTPLLPVPCFISRSPEASFRFEK